MRSHNWEVAHLVRALHTLVARVYGGCGCRQEWRLYKRLKHSLLSVMAEDMQNGMRSLNWEAPGRPRSAHPNNRRTLMTVSRPATSQLTIRPYKCLKRSILGVAAEDGHYGCVPRTDFSVSRLCLQLLLKAVG